ALRRKAFVGIHPRCRHVPPNSAFSTKATCIPSCDARIAAAYPPIPPPRTARSYSFAIRLCHSFNDCIIFNREFFQLSPAQHMLFFREKFSTQFTHRFDSFFSHMVCCLLCWNIFTSCDIKNFLLTIVDRFYFFHRSFPLISV